MKPSCKHYRTWFFHLDCCDVMSEFSHIHPDRSNLSCFQQVRVWPDQLAYFEDKEAELQPETSCDKHRKLPLACKPQMLQRGQSSHNWTTFPHLQDGDWRHVSSSTSRKPLAVSSWLHQRNVLGHLLVWQSERFSNDLLSFPPQVSTQNGDELLYIQI